MQVSAVSQNAYRCNMVGFKLKALLYVSGIGYDIGSTMKHLLQKHGGTEVHCFVVSSFGYYIGISMTRPSKFKALIMTSAVPSTRAWICNFASQI